MVAEGIHPQVIENAAAQAGMPIGPLAIQDEVSMNLTRKVITQTRTDIEAEGGTVPVDSAELLTNRMLDEYKRPGKSDGAGFYDYPAKGKKTLWPEIEKQFTKPEIQLPFEDIKERFLFRMSLETLRCYEEKVLMSVRDANIGSIFGIGFAPWTGGAIQYVNQYGVSNFHKRAKQFSELYGERFTPPKILEQHAEKDQDFI